jgi:hypothetical protein
MSLFFKPVDTCPSRGTKDLRVWRTLFGALDFAILSKIRNSVVFGLGTITEPLIAGNVGIILHSFDTGTAIITNAKRVSRRRFSFFFLAGGTNGELSSATNTRPLVGTVAEPSFP